MDGAVFEESQFLLRLEFVPGQHCALLGDFIAAVQFDPIPEDRHAPSPLAQAPEQPAPQIAYPIPKTRYRATSIAVQRDHAMLPGDCWGSVSDRR